MTMAIRVRMLRTRYPHWGGHSGFGQLAQHLDPTVFDVRMRLVSDSDEEFPIRHAGLRRRVRRYVQARGMGWYKLSDLAAEMRTLRECLLGGVDIVHYLDAEHSAQYLPKLLRHWPGRRPRVVATYHQPAAVLPSLLRQDVVARLDRVTVVSPEQMAYFRGILPGDRVRVLLHGIDTDYFRPGDRRPGHHPFRCITVGHYLRDFDALRRVAALLLDEPAIELHVVSPRGVSPGEMPNITVYTGIDDAELLALYQQSDVLFLPLLGATANNGLLEGIACGLPVVSSELPSVRCYVPDGEAILIERNDPEQLACALRWLMGNPSARQRMGALARKRAEQLSWSAMAQEYARLYCELCPPSQGLGRLPEHEVRPYRPW